MRVGLRTSPLHPRMETPYHEGQTFDRVVFSEKPLPKGEYENCVFTRGDFGNANLSGFRFTDCTFTDCNLSLAKLANVALRTVAFNGCKLVGVRFEQANPFLLAVRFGRCNLHLASFHGLKLKGTLFRDCLLRETDFTGADLTGAVFAACDLQGALFERTVLEKADFRTAFHYAIDPDVNSLRKARFSALGLAGLLGKYELEIE